MEGLVGLRGKCETGTWCRVLMTASTSSDCAARVHINKCRDSYESRYRILQPDSTGPPNQKAGLAGSMATVRHRERSGQLARRLFPVQLDQERPEPVRLQENSGSPSTGSTTPLMLYRILKEILYMVHLPGIEPGPPAWQMERKKAIQFQPKESRMLMKHYVKNYEKYHASFTSGRIGKEVRDEMQDQWAQSISSMGVARRTRFQIEEKIRNERKKVKRFIMLQRQKINGIGGYVTPLPDYLQPLLHLMIRDGHKHDNGIPGLIDEVRNSGDEKSYNSQEMVDESVFDAEMKPNIPSAVELREREEGIERLINTATKETNTELCADRLVGVPEEDMTMKQCVPTINDMTGTNARTAEGVETGQSIEPTPTRCHRRKSYAQTVRESITQRTDARSTLYVEAVKLCKLRQEQVSLKNAIRKKELEIRAMELDKMKLEMEVLAAKKQFYCARSTPTRPPSYDWPEPLGMNYSMGLEGFSSDEDESSHSATLS